MANSLEEGHSQGYRAQFFVLGIRHITKMASLPSFRRKLEPRDVSFSQTFTPLTKEALGFRPAPE